MQHNFVLGAQGSLDALGAAADVVARSPNGLAQQYVPDSPAGAVLDQAARAGPDGDVPVQGAGGSREVSLRLHVPGALENDERHPERRRASGPRARRAGRACRDWESGLADGSRLARRGHERDGSSIQRPSSALLEIRHVCEASAPVVALAVVLAAAFPRAQGRRPPVKVLFLGHHSEHHNSAKFEPMLAAALAAEKIAFDYTEDPADLNPAKLAQYDALMIYANHTDASRRSRRRRCSTTSPAARRSCRSTRRRSASRTRRPTSRWSARSSRSTAPASSPRRSSSPNTR